MVQMAQPTWVVAVARQVIASHQIRKELAEAVVQELLSFAMPYPMCQHLILMLPTTPARTLTTSHLQQH
jgi:hypothetical protein